MDVQLKKILITGGSGFLGKYVIKRFLSAGYKVVALSRSSASAEIVTKLGAEVLAGDIEQVDKFKMELGKFDVVIHCAAPVEFWGPWEKFQKGILNSSVNLSKACAEEKVKRFIYLSSESVLQDREDLLNIDERHPYPKEPNSFYGKSKMLAEKELLATKGDMEIVILRPTFIWGPGCPAFSAIDDKLRADQFVWIDQGKVSFEAVHVENVAEAVYLAMIKGKDRQIYYVTDNEASTVRDFFESYFQATGQKTPTQSIPGFIVKPAAHFIESIWRHLKLKSYPPLTRFDLSFVSMSRSYNIQKIINDLEYKPIISRAEGFKKLITKYQD